MAISYAWSEEEEAILAERYEELGPMGCMEYLPGRTHKSISSRAKKRGIRYDRYGQAKTEQLHVELSRMMRTWHGPVERSALRWAA